MIYNTFDCTIAKKPFEGILHELKKKLDSRYCSGMYFLQYHRTQQVKAIVQQL